MWYEIFKFEIKYRLRRPETYIFFLFLFLFSVVGVDFVFQGVDLGQVKKNAPIVIAKTMGAITGIFMILASMIMGVPVLRDFEYDIASLMYVNPIKKRDYLLGRFLGSFTILLFIFSGVLFGMILGEFLPWRTTDDLLPLEISNYIITFVSITLPTLFFGATLFFVTGMLSRKLVVVYTQGVIFFVLFLLTKAIKNEYLQAILDPFSLTTLTLHTKTWTALERNTRSILFEGVIMHNKMFWLLLGMIVLSIGYRLFKFTIISNPKRKRKGFIQSNQQSKEYIDKIPIVTLKENLITKWKQFVHLSKFYFIGICKQPSFWAIVICGMIIILINSVNLGTVYDVDSYPATYFIVEELQETSIYFFIIILVFYSGELIWKEREAKLDLIHDATAISDFVRLAAKYAGLILVYLVLIVALIISGILFQTIKGYHNYELQVYLYGFFIEILPFLALYTFVAFFMQALINRKFVGIMAVIVFFILNILLAGTGYDHDLYMFAGKSLGTYSDMNGYAHFLKPYLLVKGYWFLFGLLLLIIGGFISTRGTETGIKQRVKIDNFKNNRPLLKLGAAVSLCFVLLGSYIFYNMNILNGYWSRSEQASYRAGYEKELKHLEYKIQPKITDVNLNVDLFPSKRNYKVEGMYTLKNTHSSTISEIHLQKLIATHVSLDSVTFEGGATLVDTYSKYHYAIYKLKRPLNPGDSIQMNFVQTRTIKGFETGGGDTDVVYNGTFLSNKSLPTIGYNRKYELRDKVQREEYDLPIRLNKAKFNNQQEQKLARNASDADLITFEIVVSTDIDQTAIAPGSLKKQWVDNNRNYFHYKMDTPIINFYSIVSARYDSKKDTWSSIYFDKPVDLEIYYHEKHTYNIDRMMKSMKHSLDYFSQHFSPYQYEQLRIMEFPRYETFAQSFPGTIPFSEAIGFVLDIDDEQDVDMAFYVTAHEVAHQWWGMQVEAANVQGQNMILETLAQYSALMVLQKNYPKEKIEQFLEFQKEAYRIGRIKESEEELSLSMVENQEYIYYNKGAINMYVLQEQIGEEKVNLALQRFIRDWNSIDGTIKTSTSRYATTKDLLAYIKEVASSDDQYIISELFELPGDPKTY